MGDFYSAVFFDMDGLFVDSEPQWLQAETELLAEFDYDWTTEDQNFCLGGPLTRVGQYMYEKSGQKESPEFFTCSVVDRMVVKLSAGAPVLPGALELVQELKQKNIPTALISASPRVLVDAVLRNIPEQTFMFSLSADDVKNPKPDPEAYLKAAHQLGIEIENCLILEDSPTGVKAATASGAFVIAVPHFVRIDPKNRLRVVDSISELNYSNLQTSYARDK